MYVPENKNRPERMFHPLRPMQFGAGYGNRTRLRGLGSPYNSRYTNPACELNYSRGGRKYQDLFVERFWACIKSETVMAGMLSKIFCKLYDALFLWENSSRSGDNMV